MSNELVGSRDWLVAELSRSFLMDRPQLDPLVAEFVEEEPFGDATALAEFLVRKNALSRFQAERTTDGEAKSLVMGPYLLAKPIGSGSMGTVYRAVGKADRHSYAVKVLPLRSVWNVRMARRQVRAFADLPPHPAVVPFVDVGTASGKHYLVWPLVEGEPLEGLVTRYGPLTSHQAARIALRLAEGLQICHERSIFHGLIKPSNILVAADGTVRLLDFGIGALLAENSDESLLDTMTTANATTGMLDCASPESILDPARRSFAGDQYSLGCVLYFCLAGRYPFPDGTMIDKMMAHQTLTPPSLLDLNPQVPPELEAVASRLMMKAPEARYRHIGELVQDLHTITSGSRSGFANRSGMVDTPSAKLMDETTPATRRTSPTAASAERQATSGEWRTKGVDPPSRRSTAPLSAVQPPTATANPQAESASPWTLPSGRRASAAVPPTAPAAPAKPSTWGRVLGKLAFWRPKRDAVVCSVLAPPALFVGETATVPLFAHSESADTVLAMGRTYFPAHQMVGSAPLPHEIPHGARLTFHVALPGLTLEPSVQKFAWRGQVMPLPFQVQVPADFRTGEMTGIASVGDGSEIILNFEFPVMVGRR